MTGREEHEIKIKKVIKNILNDLPDYITEWYNNMLASGLAIRTCSDYIHIARLFLQSISYNTKNISIDELTPLALDRYFVSLKTVYDNNGNKKKASDSHSVTTWFALKNLFEFLTNRKYIKENYVRQITKPKNRDEYRINENRILLNKKDFRSIMECAEESTHKHRRRDILILGLLMSTGMRESALVEIDIDNIDMKNKKLYVIDKGEKRHEYVLSPKIITMLNNYLDERREYDPEMKVNALFINGNKKRITRSVVVYTVEKFTDEAIGEKLSPHKLRAGFCSILYKEKHDIEFVRRAVGHSSSRVTQRYIVTDNSEKTQASEIIDSLL